jgi:hypothetical protein
MWRALLRAFDDLARGFDDIGAGMASLFAPPPKRRRVPIDWALGIYSWDDAMDAKEVARLFEWELLKTLHREGR